MDLDKLVLSEADRIYSSSAEIEDIFLFVKINEEKKSDFSFSSRKLICQEGRVFFPPKQNSLSFKSWNASLKTLGFEL